MVKLSSIVILLGIVIAIGLLPLPIPGLGVVFGLLVAVIGIVLRLMGL